MAILFFLNNYNSSLPSLPGVENDEKELKEVFKKYKKIVTNSSKNVLEDVQDIVQLTGQKELERVHFHFSGIGYFGFSVYYKYIQVTGKTILEF